MSHASFARVRKYYGARMATLGVGVVVFLVVAMGIGASLKGAPFRQAFVVSTDPVRIISWDSSKTAMHVVSIPSEILIQGALGYGQYALSALKTLDGLDHKQGILFSESIGQALGVPISGTVFPTVMLKADVKPLDALKKVFSWGSIGKRLFHRIDTTASLADWIHIVFVIHTLGESDVEILNLASAVSDTTRPDGITVHVLDPQKVDYILGNNLNDIRLRQENKTVTIINTTNVLGIGSQIARMMNRFGIQVVSVGNQAELIEQCQLETDKKTKKSLTYQFLKAYYQCTEKSISSESDVSDIILRLGSKNAEKFE